MENYWKSCKIKAQTSPDLLHQPEQRLSAMFNTPLVGGNQILELKNLNFPCFSEYLLWFEYCFAIFSFSGITFVSINNSDFYQNIQLTEILRYSQLPILPWLPYASKALWKTQKQINRLFGPFMRMSGVCCNLGSFRGMGCGWKAHGNKN